MVVVLSVLSNERHDFEDFVSLLFLFICSCWLDFEFSPDIKLTVQY